MEAIQLAGKLCAEQIESDLRERVSNLMERRGQQATLATILVGADPSSATYVKMKATACDRIGARSVRVELPDSTTTQELLHHIHLLNERPDVHGILLQHPVPRQIDERRCFDAISTEKDVDGVTCLGFGKISMNLEAYGSATPMGIMRLLKHYQIEIRGRHAVVVGRSPILGKPMAMMMLNADATVTVCHSRTEGLAEIVATADVVVGAVGKPEFIKGSWIKDSAVVIDAGYHPGRIGDIELSAVKNRCFAYTPVPGGVGPMTIATLISQTVDAAERAARIVSSSALGRVSATP